MSGFLRWHAFDFHRTSIFNVFPFRPLAVVSSHDSPAETLSYWHRPHTSKTRLPILFIHGIGVGLFPYASFLAALNEDEDSSDGQQGIIAVEMMSISSRITGEAHSKDVVSKDIHCILKSHGWDKVLLVTHS
jgi:pimeloyl-ACP methyl ester carboxylesterase